MLVIGPHPDDQEIGMGGAIARFAEQGHEVLLLDMTDGSPTPHGDRASRLLEAEAALGCLQPGGAKGTRLRRVLLDLPNRRVQHTLEARHAVAGVIRAQQTQVMFVPYPEDAHPDHLAVTRIAEDARFDAKLTKLDVPVPPGFDGVGPPVYPKWVIYYYCSHLRKVPDPTFILDTTGQAEKKYAALAAYRSQFGVNPLNAGVMPMLRSSDAFFGARIGTAAGEPFWTREPLGLTGLAELA